MKRELNKWQYGISAGRYVPWRVEMRLFIRIWFLKLISFPTEGAILTKEHYKGFMIYKEFSLPDIIIRQRTFTIFGKRLIVVYPIKINFS